MAENLPVADGTELAWREKAMWLLIRRIGDDVIIRDSEWEAVPERPDLIIDRVPGGMKWTAREAAPPAADLEAGMPGQMPLPGVA